MTSPLYIAFNATKDAEEKLLSDAKYLTRYFCEECGFRPLPWMERKFKALLDAGWDVPTLESVICCTAMAPRPSWAYLAAIVRNSGSCAGFSSRHFPPSIPLNENHYQPGS